MGDPGWIPLSGSARLRLPSWTPPVREVEELAALPLRAARHQALGATGNENARHGDGPLLCRRRRVRLGKTPMHRSRRSRSRTRSCVCMGTEREQDLPAANLKLCVSFRRSYQVTPMTVLAGPPKTRVTIRGKICERVSTSLMYCGELQVLLSSVARSSQSYSRSKGSAVLNEFLQVIGGWPPIFSISSFVPAKMPF